MLGRNLGAASNDDDAAAVTPLSLEQLLMVSSVEVEAGCTRTGDGGVEQYAARVAVQLSGLLASTEEAGFETVGYSQRRPTEVLIRVRRTEVAACPRCRRHTATAEDRPCDRCEAVLATL